MGAVAVFVLTACYVLISLFIPVVSLQWEAVLAMLAFSGLAIYLAVTGHQYLAALLITVSGWMTLSLVSFVQQPLIMDSLSSGLFFLLLIFTTLTLGGRLGLLLVLMISLTGFLTDHLYILTASSEIEPRTLLVNRIEGILLHGITVLLIDRLVQRLLSVVDRLHQSEQALADRNRQLQAEASQHKMTADSLKRQTAQLNLALKTGRMRTWEWDLRTDEVRGLNLPNADGKWGDRITLRQIYTEVHPDDLPHVKSLVDACVSQRQPYQCDYRQMQPDGTCRWIMAIGGPVMDEHNTVIGVSGISQDVTELKRAHQDVSRLEERFYKAFHANPIPIAIITADAEPTFIDMNESWAALFGYSLYELVGVSATETRTWVHPDDILRLQSVLEAEGCVHNMEIWRKTHTGEKILVQTNIEAIELGNDKYWLVMLEDVTERKRLADQEMELALARERVTVLRDFLSVMSHDLKTPLTVMTTSLHLMERMTDPVRRQQKAEVIREQVSLINHYIQDTLAIARLDYTPDLKKDDVCLPEIIGVVQNRLNLRIQEKQQHLHIEVEESLPMLQGDYDELERVFVNLIENAVNYTPEEGSITVRAQQSGAFVHVQVQDTGIGIAPEDQERVFERFYRTIPGRKTHLNGTGLGLAIVKRVVEMHGGRIELQSALGEGTIFHVWLPVMVSSEDEATPATSALTHPLLSVDAHADD